MGVQSLASSRLEHVGPHLLDGPAQLFTEQEDAEIDEFRDSQFGDLLKQLVIARIGDLGVEELIRAQIAFGPGIADRCHSGLIERRTKQPRRTQQRDREKRLDLVHVSKSTLVWNAANNARASDTAMAAEIYHERVGIPPCPSKDRFCGRDYSLDC